MSLTSALRIAQGSLFSTSLQTSVTSRNITEAGSQDYVRRDASLVSAEYGARVVSIRRDSNASYFAASTTALSDSVGQSRISAAAMRLDTIVNGFENGSSPSTLIANFQGSLELYASDPSNPLNANAAVNSAREVANGLQSASMGLRAQRASVDSDIAAGVATVNDLLAQFEVLNNEVIQGTVLGQDVNDALDGRDAIVKQLSEFLPVTTGTRANNDMTLYTSQGVTLFETIPRTVSFTATTYFGPGSTGNPILVDGVPLAAGSGAVTDASGSLAADLQVRDELIPDFEAQLDVIANSLITAFAETDQSGGGLPAMAGLFSWSGGPAMPTTADGLASSITINPAYDPGSGGDATLLRDGGANGGSYLYNADGLAGFSDRLVSLAAIIDQDGLVAGTAEIAGSHSIASFSESVIGWLDGIRSTASASSESKAALSERLELMLSDETGVNLDEELSILVELEQSYQASARIISVVDGMIATLMDAVR